MKNLLRAIFICLPLVACIHDDVQPVDAQIPYPDLEAQTAFDDVQLESAGEIADIAEAKTILSDVLSRLMNVTEIANQMADEVAAGSSPNPLFKTRARALKILDATSVHCSNADGEDSKTESLIQNDADNSGSPSKGDEWFYIWEGCENSANNSTVTGVMAFTGMTDPLGELNSSLDSDEFTDYKYSFDLQVDDLNQKSVFLQNTKFIFSRKIVDDNEITTLEILPDSLMGVISGENLYVFKINNATLISDEDEMNLDLSIDARYFYSKDDASGYVDVSTIDNLVFEYDLGLTDPQNVSSLVSGSLELVGHDNETAKMALDTNVSKLKITLGSDSESVDQSLFFENGYFSLVNLTGLSN